MSREFKKNVFKKSLYIAYTLVFGIYSFVSLFIPFEIIIPNYTSFPIYKKTLLLAGFAIFPVIIGIVFFLAIIIILGLKKRHKYSLGIENENFFIVEYGDMHKIMFPEKTPKNSYTVIIPVHNELNRIFDFWETQGRSIHGNWILEIKNNPERHNNITLEQINDVAQKELKCKYSEKYVDDVKTEYDIGDGIRINGEIIGVANVNYYFIATNMISENDKSYYRGNSKETVYLSAIQSIVDAYTQELNQQIVYMPIIGGGFAGMEKPQSELLSLIYGIFRFNGLKIKSDVHVVIYRDKHTRPKASIYL